MRALADDLRFALRSFRRTPGFAVAAVIVLALGIGANTAIFSVVDAVILRPLPYARPGELVVVGHASVPDRPFRGSASWPTFRQWREGNRTLPEMAAYHGDVLVMNGAGAPQMLPAIACTANLFDLLGVPPALGRGFAPGEDEPGRNRVVVLSDGLWRRAFAADPGILGRVLMLDGEPHTVIGVAGPGFRFPPTEHAGELWLPMPRGFPGSMRHDRQVRSLQVVGRLAPGASVAQARAELAAIKARIDRQHHDVGAGALLTAAPLASELQRPVRSALLSLLLAVACVLVIACANVANLLLARATIRRRELAVRAALGAGRGRILRQLLTENLLLGAAGALVGLLLAFWGLEALVGLLPANMPRPHDIAIDGRVLIFAAALALLASLAAGLLPALSVSRGDIEGTLRAGARSSAGGGGRARSVLLVAEIAISFLLLVGAGLALRSFARVTAVDAGFRPERLLTAQLSLPTTRYQGPRIAGFYQRLLEKVQAVPGVEAAALAMPLPYTSSNVNLPFVLPDRPPPPPGERLVAPSRFVSPGYFALMGARLQRGRLLQPGDDRPGAPPVAVVNESLARRYWPGEDPVGKRLEVVVGFPGVREVVGVVSDVKSRLDQPAQPEMYLSFDQTPPLSNRLLVVSAAHPRGLLPGLTAAVASLDRSLPLGEVMTMDQRLGASLQQRRLSALLLGIFALLALVLSAAGVYGVMSYATGQRTREIGVRMALGAGGPLVLRMVLGQGLRLVILGLALGLAGALALSRIFASQLYGISATDPGTYGGLGILLLAVAALATLLPARRATKVDPMIALRAE